MVKRQARICRYCRSELPLELGEASDQRSDWRRAGCMGIIVLFLVGFLVALVRGPSEEDRAEDAARRQKGFHCLNAMDGSSYLFEAAVKKMLRDPESFEHIATYIAPEKDGRHSISMQYRARNGFGGMNVSSAIGYLDHDSCEASVVTIK